MMNVAERDDLLIRMDERQKQIFDMNMMQERHLSELNAKVVHNVIKIAANEGRILTVERILEQGVPLKLTKKQIAAGGGSILTVVSSLVLAAGKLAGWW